MSQKLSLYLKKPLNLGILKIYFELQARKISDLWEFILNVVAVNTSSNYYTVMRWRLF